METPQISYGYVPAPVFQIYPCTTMIRPCPWKQLQQKLGVLYFERFEPPVSIDF